MKKKLTRILLALAALVVLALVILWFSLDAIVRSKVESTAQSSLGQPTTLRSARLKPFAGTLDLSGLDIANPKDFKLPRFLALKDCTITVQTGSLLGDTVVVHEIVIDGLHLTLEQNGLRNNLQDILASIQKQRQANDAGAPQDGQKPQSKQLKIGRIRLTNTEVTIRMAPVPNQPGPELHARLAAMEIDDPTNPDGRLMKFADLAGKILVQIAASAAQDPSLPPDVRTAFKTTTQLLDQNLGKLFRDLSPNVQKLQQDLQKATQGLGDVGKNLGNLFNKKEPATQPR